MPVFPATYTVDFSAAADWDGTTMPLLTLNPNEQSHMGVGGIRQANGTIDDADVGDVYTKNETVNELTGSPFDGSDAAYVGTITIGGNKYPVFFDAPLFGSFPPLFRVAVPTFATANAIATAGFSFTPTDENFAACFAAGTEIATPDGVKLVEDLQIGDMVLTADGRSVAVQWTGHQDLFPTSVTPHMQPVRISAGALGENTPSKDLVLTGDHAMFVDGYLVNASALVNGDTIDYLPLAECEFRLRVYHVETEAHEVLVANGAASESYLDIPSRKTFDNFDSYTALYGAERTIQEMAVPRISSARMLPASIRELIKAETPVFAKLAKTA